MYYDIVDVIKNLQTLTIDDSAFRVLKDFERVLDGMDMYVFRNWIDGELLSGPEVSRYTVTCKFMWPRKHMPDPTGAERLTEYGCKVYYEKRNILIPRKVRKQDDFRPNTKKGKLDAHPIWVITITMPKKLMQDIYVGYETKAQEALADMMKTHQPNVIPSVESMQSEIPEELPTNDQAEQQPQQPQV